MSSKQDSSVPNKKIAFYNHKNEVSNYFRDNGISQEEFNNLFPDSQDPPKAVESFVEESRDLEELTNPSKKPIKGKKD